VWSSLSLVLVGSGVSLGRGVRDALGVLVTSAVGAGDAVTLP
jgi:hypothetical protein